MGEQLRQQLGGRGRTMRVLEGPRGSSRYHCSGPISSESSEARVWLNPFFQPSNCPPAGSYFSLVSSKCQASTCAGGNQWSGTAHISHHLQYTSLTHLLQPYPQDCEKHPHFHSTWADLILGKKAMSFYDLFTDLYSPTRLVIINHSDVIICQECHK